MYAYTQSGDLGNLQIVLDDMADLQVPVDRKSAYSSLLWQLAKSSDVIKSTNVIDYLRQEAIFVEDDLVNELWYVAFLFSSSPRFPLPPSSPIYPSLVISLFLFYVKEHATEIRRISTNQVVSKEINAVR